MNNSIRVSMAMAITLLSVVPPVSAELIPIARLPIHGFRATVNINNHTLYVGTCLEETLECGVVPYSIRNREVLPFVETHGTFFFFNPVSNSLFATNYDDTWVMNGETYEVEHFSYANQPSFAVASPGAPTPKWTTRSQRTSSRNT